MRRTGILFCLAPVLAGCGGPQAPSPGPLPVGEVKLGMNVQEVASALGPPERTATTRVGDSQLELAWTYKSRHHVLLKDASGDLDFPAGCVLVFGGDPARLTGVTGLGIPESRPRPPVLPAGDPVPTPAPAPPAAATSAPSDPRVLVSALMGRPAEELQPLVEAVMLRFPDCLPTLVESLSGPDQPLPASLRLFVPALPGQPPDRMRRVRPASRAALVLALLNQGTGEHFGVLEKPEDLPALAAQWKAWLAARPAR